MMFWIGLVLLGVILLVAFVRDMKHYAARDREALNVIERAELDVPADLSIAFARDRAERERRGERLWN